MEDRIRSGPDPATLYPLPGYEHMVFLKNQVRHPQIEVGDYTYYDDSQAPAPFEQQVRYLFGFTGDKLVIGKFCMIASGVQFIMNGANHLTESISSYPFAIFGQGWEHAMDGKSYPNRGDTVVGNDVWIGYQATILPGVRIGDGAIIGAGAVVTRDVAPYSVAGGNPARELRKRFSPEQIETLLRIRWWDWPAERITAHAHLLTGGDVDAFARAAADLE
ncbi:MAG: CatB-related O-acetyltransferase [Bacteroidia bacterium]|nr:CatB-related O-acetyltransferase [Bacteroidia bacterium]